MSMVERVALAIIAERNVVAEEVMKGGAVGLAYDGDVGPRLARAAIEAMREPTPEMVQAALIWPSKALDYEDDPVIGNDLGVEKYRLMIEEALK